MKMLLAACTVLLLADVLGLWTVPANLVGSAAVLPSAVLGAGLAAAGGATLFRQAAGSSGWRLSCTGLVLLCAPALAEIGQVRAAETVATMGFVVLTPWALARITPVTRARQALNVLIVLTLLAGLVSVLGVALRSFATGAIAGSASAGLLFCLGWLQFEVTMGAERRKVLWLLLGVCSSVPLASLFMVATDTASVSPVVVTLIASLLCLPVPLCAAIAVGCPDAFDVRTAISRTVLALVMTALTGAVYATASTAVEASGGRPPSLGILGLLVTGIAAGFHPVLVAARGSIDEMLFGGRADPVDTMSRLGAQLTAGTAPEQWLESLRVALGVGGLVLRRGDDVLAAAGNAVGPVTRLPLQSGPEVVGELLVTLSAEQLRLPAATRAVLQLVTAPLAQALQAVHLTDELKRSRGLLVGVLEEERRRMRRDLHDGLGPALTGVAYTADAAANLVVSDAVQAESLIRQLRVDVGEAIAEIRRIVYGLRPRALDELGLVGAVLQRAERLRTDDGRPFAVSTAAPPLEELPAAVEVVAYRVAVEALTNVARHSRADGAQLSFRLTEDVLEVLVLDEGCTRAPWSEGVGIASMRERVEQIGGWLEVGAGAHGGRVLARLPVT